MRQVALQPSGKSINEKIFLTSSKSESNRALIINALAQNRGELQNLSAARDTQTMQRLLQSDEPVADVLDAGTTMRFLTAYFSVTNQKKLMTGTDRMCERPIGILVDALRKIGVSIDYKQKEGYPPHQINGFTEQLSAKVELPGNVSSQYISALLMVAPVLPQGLTIQMVGEVGSKPYITMTIEQMKAFGVTTLVDWAAQTLYVAPQTYQPTFYRVESDWSGASYWFSVVALSPKPDTRIELIGLKENSLQGDSKIVEIMRELGVASKFTPDGVLLTKTAAADTLTYDFSNCPDLVQTIAVVCAAKGIEANLTGIESLKIKETDRVAALQNELAKIGGELNEVETNHLYQIPRRQTHAPTAPIDTYDDHRMAMAFAPLAMLYPVTIDEPGVVAKSYPTFWDDFAKVAEVSFQ